MLSQNVYILNVAVFGELVCFHACSITSIVKLGVVISCEDKAVVFYCIVATCCVNVWSSAIFVCVTFNIIFIHNDVVVCRHYFSWQIYFKIG